MKTEADMKIQLSSSKSLKTFVKVQNNTVLTYIFCCFEKYGCFT